MVKKFAPYLFVAATILATSCNGGSSSMKEQLDSLQTALEQRNSDYNELNEYLTVIAEGLDSIAIQEDHLLTTNSTPGESPALSREQIKQNLAAYKQTLENQRRRIAQLEKQLKNGNANNAQLKTIIASLKQQLAQKDAEIEELRSQLNDQSKDIATLMADLANLRKHNASQASQLAEQEDILKAQDQMINEAYVKIGTKAELKELGLLTGGFLKKTKVDFSKMDKSLFTPIDIRKSEKIEIPSKKAKVLTPQPEDSYRIDVVYKNSVLSVTDPAKFWSVSNFVIIQTD